MRARSVFAVLILLAIAAIAAAVPEQPFMKAARGDLMTARSELQQATANKGGHRVKAIGLVNSAIAEVNEGIAFDRRHNHASTLNSEELFAGAQDQPHMTTALAALESAKNNLDKASTDKGGHRKNALDYVKDAISEVKKGIEAGRN